MTGESGSTGVKIWKVAPLAVLVATLVLRVNPTWGQVLIVSPDCAVPGNTMIKITGSGWVPQGPQYCVNGQQEYRFYIDGGPLIPPQPIIPGLSNSEQPNPVPFVLPAGTSVGTHMIKTQLWANLNNGGWKCFQCVETKLCVQSSTGPSPWSSSTHGGGQTRAGLELTFNPTLRCELPHCKSLRYIQIVKMEGFNSISGLWEPLTYADMPAILPQNLVEQSLIASSGWSIDYESNLIGGPWYQFQEPHERGRSECDMNKPSLTPDYPGHSDGLYVNRPGRVDTKVRMSFETYAVCGEEGPHNGQALGVATWVWTRDYGSNTHGGGIISTPAFNTGSGTSANHGAATAQWRSVPGLPKLPAPKDPQMGGVPCVCP